MRTKISIFWFRRDLRLEDNTALNEALKGPLPVFPFFIFDPNILNELEEDDARVTFLYDRVRQLRKQLEEMGSTLAIFRGDPLDVIRRFNTRFEVRSIYANHDYEPYARDRDSRVKVWCMDRDISYHTFKDQVIFEKSEVVKQDGDPYVVYTPYMKTWKARLQDNPSAAQPATVVKSKKLIPQIYSPSLSLESMGFKRSKIQVPEYDTSKDLIAKYKSTRDVPALADGTSRLGPHLRFGTVSIRSMVQKALKASDDTFLNELIWREFFMQILWHYPHTTQNAFKPKYDRIQWRNNEEEFELWKTGNTGYPMVDAGIRQLNKTGYMHNRVRMVTASFLCKHLLIDWRWGEAYFASKLLDFELSSNVGNWQWAAGTGVDAAPYFRIFNPTSQMKKFDKNNTYIKKWIPEFGTEKYPEPMVDHSMARERCLRIYKEALT